MGKLLTNLMGNPYQLHALRVLLGVATHPALPQQAPQPAEHAAAIEPLTAAAATAAMTSGKEGAEPAGASDPMSYQIARQALK